MPGAEITPAQPTDRTMAEFDPEFDARQAAAAELAEVVALVPRPQASQPERALTDALAGLLADGDDGDGEGGALDLGLLARLGRLRAQKAIYESQAKALTAEIEKLNRAAVEHIAEATGADLREKWSTTVNLGAETATAYVKTSDYPVYRYVDEDQETKYGMADLVKALKASTVPGLADMVKETVHGQTWNSTFRRLVEAWRARVDETGGPTDDAGEPVDAFGNVLTADEREDPTADELGLPPEVRALVTVSTKSDLMFRAR